MTDALIFTEQNQRNVEELKELNQVNLAAIIPEESKKPEKDAVEVEKGGLKSNNSAPALQIETDKQNELGRFREEFIGA